MNSPLMGENEPSPFVTQKEFYEALDKLLEKMDKKFKNDRRYFWATMLAVLTLATDAVPRILAHIK